MMVDAVAAMDGLGLTRAERTPPFAPEVQFLQSRSRQERERTFWNRLYAGTSAPTRPNRFLSEVASLTPPGRLLDLGAGNGRNALPLAEAGWQVTGLDISDTGLLQAALAASRRQLPVDARLCATEQFDAGRSQWDLICECYGHRLLPEEVARLTAALVPGGLLVVEGVRDEVSLETPFGRRPGYRGQSLLETVEPLLRVLHYEQVLDVPDWGGRSSRAPLVRLVAARR